MRLYHFNPLFPLILLLILDVNATTQFETGTVIIVGYSHDKIIVAADSRQPGEKGEHVDNGCKITVLNNKFFFTATGRANDITHGVVGWSASICVLVADSLDTNPSRRDLAELFA